MVMKNTIAKNHLSNESMLSSKGRYGDTEILRFSGGERAHGNIKEKALMSMYGQQGEKMVKAAGSGSTNPSTGLPEYFDPVTMTAVAAGASALIGATGAMTAGKAKQTQAKYDMQAADQGLTELDKTQGLLETGYESKKAAASQDYSMGVEKLSGETGIAREDLAQQHSQALQKSGLATSGSVETKKSQTWGRIQNAFGRGRKGLLAGLGQKMGTVESWYEGEKARISSERLKFQRQKDLAEEQSQAWFLGGGRTKNLFNPTKWSL